MAAVSRRGLFGSTLGAAATAATASLVLGSGVRSAGAMDQDKFYPQMRSYGAKDTKPCPDGFNPVLEFYGKTTGSTVGGVAAVGVAPLLVTYNSPNGWLLVRPNIDNNGEDGTISSGDYGKGDSASFYNGAPLKAGQTLENRAELEALIFAALTVKGASQYQGFTVTKVTKLDAATNQPYYICEYKYTLLTGAGFAIDRIGIGSATAVGTKSTQAMVGASTDIRWKKTKGQLREVAESFRVYAGVKPPSSLK